MKTYRWSPFCDLIDFPGQALVGALNRASGRRLLLPKGFGALETLRGRPMALADISALAGSGKAASPLLRRLIDEDFLVDARVPEAALFLAREGRHRAGAKDFAPPPGRDAPEALSRAAVPRPGSRLAKRLGIARPEDVRVRLDEALELLRRLAGVPSFLDAPELLCLYFLAQTIPPRGEVVEVGSFLGASAAALALGARRIRKAVVRAVDLWPSRASGARRPDYALYRRLGLLRRGSLYPLFRANISRLGLRDDIRPVRADSRAVARSWKGPIALLFLDGSHFYEDVRRDLALARRLVPGGLLVVDDHGPAHPGVMWAVREHWALGGYGERERCGKLLWARRAA